MPAYMHITRLSSRTGTHNATVDEYQLNFVNSGINYAATWDEDRLIEFLRDRIALDDSETAQVLERLHQAGHATIGDIDLRSEEVTSAGMEMISD